jgi:hypothetical protein
LPLLEIGSLWIRSHDRRYGPIYFGKAGRGRFDAPSGQYGILYVAADVRGAFIETFGRELGRRVIDLDELNARAVARITSLRTLRRVDLTGAGLARIGADARLTSETANRYALSQRWALALFEHSDQPDGLLYRSRHDPSRLCAAIFDRAANVLTATPLGSLADVRNAALLADLLDTYEYGLIGP